MRLRSSVVGPVFFAMLLCAGLLGSRARAEVTPVAGWDRQLFPSYLISTAAVRLPADDTVEADENNLLGDRQGVLGVVVTSPADDTEVSVTISADSILEESTFTGTMESGETTYTILPRVRYKYDALAENKQSVPVAITFRVQVGDEEPEEETLTFTLRSINDCPYYIHHDDEVTDVSFTFAAYVNEQHPFCDKVLREALDAGVVDSFTGYQSGDEAEVHRQVYAIWNALTKRDVRYSNITTESAANQIVSSQHVRLIDESINNSQANCVDGSVLLASLLRKIDIEPVLIYVPGHCYLGFYLDQAGEHFELLETTMIGGESEAEADKIPGLEDVVEAQWAKEQSWLNYRAAIETGRADYAEKHDKFNKDDPEYQTVSIKAARAMGILPIAFDGEAEFAAVRRESDADDDAE